MKSTINYSLLRSNELFTFTQRIIELLDGADLTGSGIDILLEKLKEAFGKFSDAFERDSKDPYTVKLAAMDAVRDTSFYGFRTYIEACVQRTEEGWHDAAVKILDVVRKHGWNATSMGYKAETAAIENITSELREKCVDEITLLSAGDWLTGLENAQKKFEDMVQEKVKQPKDNPTLTQTRPDVVSTLKSLLSLLYLQGMVQESEELQSLTGSVNELIGITMTSARANASRSANQNDEDGGDVQASA